MYYFGYTSKIRIRFDWGIRFSRLSIIGNCGRRRRHLNILLSFFFSRLAMTGDKPFKCPECNLCFRTTGHRQSHLKSHRKAAQVASKTDSDANHPNPVAKKKSRATKITQQVNPNRLKYFIQNIYFYITTPRVSTLRECLNDGVNCIDILSRGRKLKMNNT